MEVSSKALVSTVKTVRRQDSARTLPGLCQDSVRTLSGLCQDSVRTVRTGAGGPQTRFAMAMSRVWKLTYETALPPR